MEFYEVVNGRRTIRQFEDRAIAKDALRRILDAGLKAPSSDHMRQWAPVVLTDRADIEQLAGLVSSGDANIDEPKTPQQEMFKIAFPKQSSMLSESGALILPYFRQTGPLFKPENVFTLINYGATWALIENMLLAATAEGLASAIHIPVANEAQAVGQLVGVPADYVLPAVIAVGHPAPNAEVPTQVSATVDEKVHWGKW